MPRANPQYTDEVKNRAFQLYMEGLSTPSIAKRVAQEFGCPCTATTIFFWQRREQWKTKRDDTRTRAVEQVQREGALDVAQMTREQLGAYRKVWKAAEKSIDEKPSFKRSVDAAKAVDIGIRGERDIMSGVVAVQFIRDVIQAVREEVRDEEALQRISARLKRLATESSPRPPSLPSSVQ